MRLVAGSRELAARFTVIAGNQSVYQLSLVNWERQIEEFIKKKKVKDAVQLVEYQVQYDSKELAAKVHTSLFESSDLLHRN